MENSLAIRSRIMHFSNDREGDPASLFEYYDDGILVVVDNHIRALGHADEFIRQGFDESDYEYLPKQLIIAGFIDTHVHAPQLDVIASFGEQLLDWLEKYTFPMELKFADVAYSQSQTRRFLSSLIQNGTTSAMVFTTSFKHSVDHLFEQAKSLNMRMMGGKVMMDRNAPSGLLDTAEQSQRDNEDLITRWHGNGRLSYALTPRFSGTSTPKQLALAGETFQRFPDVYVQTHLSENLDEVAWTAKLFPEASDYLNTYERYGLVTEKTIFAHCLFLTASETERIGDAGSSISFCSSSNLFLGSGLFDLETISARDIPVTLASDVGAGTSLSPFKTMSDAYKICQLKSYSLSPKEAFYRASLGSAKALGLDKYVGNLAINSEADFVVIDSANIPAIAERIKQCKTIDEELFVYMISGDERLIDRTYIAGVKQHDYKQPNFNSIEALM